MSPYGSPSFSEFQLTSITAKAGTPWFEPRSGWCGREEPGLGFTGSELVAQQDQVGPAPHAELGEQVGNMEFHRALGDMQTVREFFIGQIFEQAAQHLLLALAELGRGIRTHPAPLGALQDRVHETGEYVARDPESSSRYPQQSAGKLFARLRIVQDSLHSLTEQSKAVGLLQ